MAAVLLVFHDALPHDAAMQLLELLEVSALVASHARSLACDQPQVAEQAVIDYWVASRCRFDNWGHDLRAYSIAAAKSEQRPLTPRLFRLAVEIETSEVLARTLAALGYAHDTQHHRHETSPITTNVLAGQRDATKRMTELLAHRDESAFRDVVRFRNLRTRLHHLTDHLVACFLPFAQVAPFAHNPRDIEQLGTLAASRVARGGESCDWPTMSGMLSSLRHECSEDGANDHENHQVAAAAMGLFAPEMFDSFGLLRSTFLRRLERTEGETTVLLEEWLATEARPKPTPVNRIASS